jgi:acetaldehyde dehydrogenase/alcohol dehydrogenase
VLETEVFPARDQKKIDVENMVNRLVKNAADALDEYMKLDQNQVNNIVKSMSLTSVEHRLELAKLAIEETSRGILEDKIIKNMFASEYVFDSIREEKTVGIINENKSNGCTEIAEPLGVIAGVVPVTNPTSTTIFKSLICAKTRNPIIFAFHPNSQRCSVRTAEILLKSAVKSGAPAHCISWICNPSIEATSFLMNHKGVSLVLATGGSGLVKAAYSTGKPALGVGPGNVPCYIEKSADLKRACTDIIISKTFDNGMICASEQAIIVDKEISKTFEDIMKQNNCLFLKEDEIKKISQVVINQKNHAINSEIVGKSAHFIANKAGIDVVKNTKILIAKLKDVGDLYPLSREKLSPVLAYYVVDNFQEALNIASKILNFGGLGHSAAIHSKNEKIIKQYGMKMKVGRVISNSPSSHGAIGGLYNENTPSLTLGCGSYGQNSTLSNVSCLNLINKKRIDERKTDALNFKVSPEVYFKSGSIYHLEQINNFNRVFIITDKNIAKSSAIEKITNLLKKKHTNACFDVFFDIDELSQYNFKKMASCTDQVNLFGPDVIIAIGPDFVIDIAKTARMLYEIPNAPLRDISQKFMNIDKRIYKHPTSEEKTKFIVIPTIPAMGTEVTPFSFVVDKKTNEKHTIIDKFLQPDITILDPQFVLNLSKFSVLDIGLNILANSIESYVSIMANDFTDNLSLRAIELIFDCLIKINSNKINHTEMHEKIYNASRMSGVASANAFLGINRSMAQKLSDIYDISYKRASAILLPHVIEYNSQKPNKFTSFFNYEKFIADEKYKRIAKLLNGLIGNEKNIENLSFKIKEMLKKLNIPDSILKYNINKEDFLNNLQNLSEMVHEDQFVATNPRYPLIEEIKEIYKAAL